MKYFSYLVYQRICHGYLYLIFKQTKQTSCLICIRTSWVYRKFGFLPIQLVLDRQNMKQTCLFQCIAINCNTIFSRSTIMRWNSEALAVNSALAMFSRHNLVVTVDANVRKIFPQLPRLIPCQAVPWFRMSVG